MSKLFTENLIKTHKKVDPSCDNKAMRANKALIKMYENSYSKQEIDYLTNFQQESSIFMVFHKSTNLQTSPAKGTEEQGSEYISCFKPNDLQLFPKVAGFIKTTNSATHRPHKTYPPTHRPLTHRPTDRLS